jgi:hypothetical protein
MFRMAIFVEGQTEQIFVEKLVQEIAGLQNVQFEKKIVLGKKREVALTTSISEKKYYVLIVNSGTDNRVASDVRENYDNLIRANFSSIIAIRDVFPQKRSDIPKLRRFLGYGMKTKPISVVFVLAIMEIEAWFLSEHTHFTKLNPSLTDPVSVIKAAIGANPSEDDMTLLENPADSLSAAYQSIGLEYRKRKEDVARTVNTIDYTMMYTLLAKKIPSLGELIESIDNFLC